MYKIITGVALLAALLLLAGCETTRQISSGSAGGVGNMVSCQQINQTFAAYQRDRNSWAALKEIASMTGFDSSKLDSSKKAASYYEDVKNSVNIALLLQGCQPL